METDFALDVADIMWSVKKILSAIEKSSFLIEILLLALTAPVIVLTIFLDLKLSKAA